MGHSNSSYIANDLNSLLYIPKLNPEKLPNQGLILSDVPDKLDLESKHEVWLNKDFDTNNLKLNTVPIGVGKVRVLFNLLIV